MNEEDGAGGAEGMPDISGVDGFVGNDDEEEEQDARAQDAQPIEVDIPSTYLWGVVSAQLQTWQYKSAEKTAEGTLEALRAVAFPEDPDYKCVEKSFLCASIVKGGKESVVNGLVAIVVEEEDTIRISTYLRAHGFVACHMEVTEESVDNGAIVEADINLGVRVLDLYQAVGDQDAVVEIDLQIVRYDPKYEYKASLSINRTPRQVAQAWYNHKKTDAGKDDKLSYVQFALKQDSGSDALSGVRMFVGTGAVKGKSRAVFGPLPFEEKVTVYVEGPPRDGFDSAVSEASKDVRDQLGAIRVDGKPIPIRSTGFKVFMVKVVCPLSGLRDLMYRYDRLAREPGGWRPSGRSYRLRYYRSSEHVDKAYPDSGLGGKGGGGDSSLRAEIANFAAEVAEKHGDLAAQVQAAQEAVAEFARSSREAAERNAEAVARSEEATQKNLAAQEACAAEVRAATAQQAEMARAAAEQMSEQARFRVQLTQVLSGVNALLDKSDKRKRQLEHKRSTRSSAAAEDMVIVEDEADDADAAYAMLGIELLLLGDHAIRVSDGFLDFLLGLCPLRTDDLEDELDASRSRHRAERDALGTRGGDSESRSSGRTNVGERGLETCSFPGIRRIVRMDAARDASVSNVKGEGDGYVISGGHPVLNNMCSITRDDAWHGDSAREKLNDVRPRGDDVTGENCVLNARSCRLQKVADAARDSVIGTCKFAAGYWSAAADATVSVQAGMLSLVVKAVAKSGRRLRGRTAGKEHRTCCWFIVALLLVLAGGVRGAIVWHNYGTRAEVDGRGGSGAGASSACVWAPVESGGCTLDAVGPVRACAGTALCFCLRDNGTFGRGLDGVIRWCVGLARTGARGQGEQGFASSDSERYVQRRRIHSGYFTTSAATGGVLRQVAGGSVVTIGAHGVAGERLGSDALLHYEAVRASEWQVFASRAAHRASMACRRAAAAQNGDRASDFILRHGACARALASAVAQSGQGAVEKGGRGDHEEHGAIRGGARCDGAGTVPGDEAADVFGLGRPSSVDRWESRRLLCPRRSVLPLAGAGSDDGIGQANVGLCRASTHHAVGANGGCWRFSSTHVCCERCDSGSYTAAWRRSSGRDVRQSLLGGIRCISRRAAVGVGGGTRAGRQTA